MKLWHIIIAGLMCSLLFPSCRKNTPSSAALSGPPTVGATYSLNDGEGGFRVGKIVAVEDEVVFVRLFGERWTSRPSLLQAHKATNSTSLAFSSQSFAGMQPIHLENGSVSAEELEAYEAWQRSKRDVF